MILPGDKRGGRGLWEGETPPITALPEKNQGGEAVITRDDKRPKVLADGRGSTDYSYAVLVVLGIDDVKYPAASESAKNGNVIAVVEWGHGAGRFRAEVDFRNGAQFTLVATSVKVLAFIDPGAEPDDGTILSAHCSCAFLWGSRGGPSSPTRTEFVTVPGASDETSGSVIVQIPAFAERLIVAGSGDVMSGNAGPVTVNFLGGPDATDRLLLSFDNQAVPEYFQTLVASGGARFPEGARFLEVTNGTGSDVDVSLVWGLSL